MIMDNVDDARADGRDTRWTQHRLARRRALTEAAIAAIRRHGATVGMDEIAAVAGTSKTVIYRHLGDRLGLYLAVCEAVDAQIMTDLGKALQPRSADVPGSDAAQQPGEPPAADLDALLDRDIREVLVAVIDAYLHLVESDPEVYRFVVRRPLLPAPPASDPVAGLTDAIAETLSTIFARALRAAGRDSAPATTWAYGLIGFVRESADRWLSNTDRAPREVITAQLADFATVGLAGVLTPRGEEEDV